MKEVKLGQVCKIRNGFAFKSSEFKDDGVPIVRIGEIKNNIVNIEKAPYVNENDIFDPYIIRKNDILIALSGATTGKIGRFTLNKVAYQNQRVGCFIPKMDKLDNDYLYQYLLSISSDITKKAYGGGQPNISTKEISKFSIPLPSLNDQKYIAQILSNCENLIQKRKESIALLDELLKSTFLEMFGDPRTNSKKWEMKPVVKYADCIVPGRDKPKDFTGQTLWITTKDLEHLSYTSKSKSNKGLSNIEIEQVRARIIPKNSVLMTCVGDLGVVSIAEENMVVNQQLHTFQCKEEINNIFLMFNLSFQTHYMYKMASTTTLPYLNKTNCNSIPVIKPPIGLQNKFAAIVEKVETIKLSYQTHLQELGNLYGSISQKAFKGELDFGKVIISGGIESGATTTGALTEVIRDIETPIAGSKEPEEYKEETYAQLSDDNVIIMKPSDRKRIFREQLEEFFLNNTGTYQDFVEHYLSQFNNRGFELDHDILKTELFSLLEGVKPKLTQFFDEASNQIKIKFNEIN